MPIPQIANSSGVSSSDLIFHAQTIRTTLRENAGESRRLSNMASANSDLSKWLAQDVKAHQRSHGRAIKTNEPSGLLLDAKKLSKALDQSAKVFTQASQAFNKHARNYDNQLLAHDHLMTGFLSGFNLQTRVLSCERGANSLITNQTRYLQSNLERIAEADMDLSGALDLLETGHSPQPVTPQVEAFMDRL